MKRSFYLFGIFFVSLYVFVSLFQAFIEFRVGSPIFFRQSFLPWLFLCTTIYLIAFLTILKYYHFKKYRVSFFSMIILIIASLCILILFYKSLTDNLQNLNALAYLVWPGAAILHSMSLIFSNAGKRASLRTAGILGTIVPLVLVSFFILGRNTADFETMVTAVKAQQWASLAGDLVPVLFITNFISEWRLLKAEKGNTTKQQFLKGIMAAAGIVAVVSALIVGSNLVNNGQVLPAPLTKATESGRVLALPFEARIYVNGKGDTMRYRLMKPLDYDTNRKYPLVVCLHHGGTHGTDNIMQIEGAAAAQVLSRSENRKKYPAFLFVPQCPPGSGWGGLPFYPTVDQLVFETIGALEKEFGIDVKRRYVIGLSGGGYGSWHFICTRPKMFAAAIPICGGSNPEFAKNIVDVPVWAFHGEKDKDVNVKFSREMIEAIKKKGGHPRYTEFPDAGHNIWDLVNATPGLFDWLFAQKRN